MIEKLKYRLTGSDGSSQMRLRLIAGMAILTVGVITLLGFSTKTVQVSDGENTYTVRTVNGDVAAVVSSLNLKSENYKIISSNVKKNKTTVKIEYTFPVYITVGNTTKQVFVCRGTVGDALKTAGYKVDGDDFVYPSADTAVTDTVYIDYANVKYVSGSYTEPIPYYIETVYSAGHATGTQTVQTGKEGLQEVSFTEKIVNGQKVETAITGTTVLSAAVNTKKIVGTSTAASTTVEPAKKSTTTSSSVNCISTIVPPAAIALDASGNPVNFKSKMTVRATAYTYTGKNCATGMPPQPGCIAVNPKVIPYGTKLYIKTADGSVIYGYAVAADTGGFVSKHPTGIDLFMSTKSACLSFGVRNVDIYILE